jgi:hypothetical protein
LLIVDQAEELVTRASPEAGDQFLALLRGATRSGGCLWAVMTLRSEFLHPLLAREGGRGLLDDQVLVGPLERSALAEIIKGPAARAGVTFEPGLGERIVEDTTGGDALPLLAYTLFTLFEQVDTRSRISAGDYDNVGGVIGALRTRADRELARLGEQVIPTLSRLVAPGEREATRRRASRSEFTPSENAILDAFIDARLLTSTNVAGEPVVEVAHEALLRQWPPLVEAINQRRRAFDVAAIERVETLIAEIDGKAARSRRGHQATSVGMVIVAAAIPLVAIANVPTSTVGVLGGLIVVLAGIAQPVSVPAELDRLSVNLRGSQA